jgi:hypothetical protein
MEDIAHRKEQQTMATLIESGSAVQSGYYFNPVRWHVTPVEKDGGRLPDGKGGWMKVNTAVALLLVPILGATFLMFLPLIGFVLFLQAMALPVVRLFKGGAEQLASTMSPGWQPGEAHFTGKRPESAEVEEKGPTSSGDALDALAAEIERKRRNA